MTLKSFRRTAGTMTLFSWALWHI